VTPRAKALLPQPDQSKLDHTWLGSVTSRLSTLCKSADVRSQTAVSAHEASLTYGELDTLSNALAHRLVKGGVEKGNFCLVSFVCLLVCC
jgi:non-ribosomal peptide synthetase component E (peptide arylation enzyme)